MIPVSLKLKNFLSYGDVGEPLDFEQFHVACLSGGNGQGKSALLDAITWALWGEARKASDARKPDEDLLRIGTREMEVELVFDLDEARYRVVRSFYRTASGKTTKPGLEFQIREGGGETFRPLTAGSVKATQEVIDETIGLDYDTFINSAFLLQGRSDEFTKKKPGERKEILGRILGLDRYERYAAVARARYSEANERVKRADGDIERLNAALEEEGIWKTERTELQAALAELAREHDEARRAEQATAEQLAELDALAQSTQQLRDRLGALTTRRAELDAERSGLGMKIEEAEALIGQSEAIRRNHARYETLLGERKAWDDKLDLQRGLETQLSEKKLQLQQQRLETEGKLNRIDAQLAADKNARAQAERRLVERPAVERKLGEARAAEEEFQTLRARRDERQRLEARIAAIDKTLANEGGALKGQILTLKQQIQEAEAQAASLATLRERARTLQAKSAAVREAEEQRNAVKEEGSGAGADVAAFDRELDRLRREIEATRTKSARLAELETEDCPTCGTKLTPEHRRTVEQTYADERAALEKEMRKVEARRAQRQGEVERLRQRYRELTAQIGQQNGLADELVAVQGQVATAESAQAAVADRRAQAAHLEQQLADDAFRPDLRAERTELDDKLREIPFDPERFEAVQARAAERPHLDAQLRSLDEEQGKVETLGRQIEQQAREAATLREALADGSAFGSVREQIARLESQLASVGYDGQQHDAVRRELDALADAPERFMRLANAERNLTDWTERRRRLAAEVESGEAEAATLRVRVADADGRLGARAEMQERQRTQAARRAELTAKLSEAQARLGGLDERLERCARDREALRAAKARLKDAKRDRTLNRHLREAFGKNGIPALIIEETLPEIEERTNALLKRLSKGRTHVHLETLKDKKTGGTKETLDIKITDAGGVARPYETFSGGEAFRVNFALRIALAQLLAERSGVRIRTLVVDEGFGTQDKQGIDRIVEAIQVVRNDFDKILVITHLDELKEAFPIRIEVQKHPVEGSRYDLIGV